MIIKKIVKVDDSEIILNNEEYGKYKLFSYIITYD